MSTKSAYRVRKFIFLPLLFGLALAALSLPFSARANRLPQQGLLEVVNDDFDTPLIVSAIPYSSTQDIVSATVAADDPTLPCAGGKKYNTVWYRFTPSADEALVFSTVGSQHTTAIAIWNGERGSLVNLACTSSSQLQFAVEAGITYYIELVRWPDYIIPTPTSLNVIFAIWPADTLPAAFSKSAPEDNATNRSSRTSLKWSTSAYAAKYAYCYDTTANTLCDSAWITTTGTSADLSGLSLGASYFWQVRAVNSAGVVYANDAAWWSFSTAGADELNYWSGKVSGTTRSVSFDALTGGALWLNFSVSVPVSGCNINGNRTVIIGGPDAITAGSFSYRSPSGSLTFNGTFNTNTSASGSYRLTNYPVCVWTQPGYCCWASTSSSGSWTASGPALLTIKPLYLPVLTR